MAKEQLPDERTVYLHCSPIFQGQAAKIRQLTAVNRRLSANHKCISILSRDFSLPAIANVVKRLLDDRIFESPSLAQSRFPTPSKPKELEPNSTAPKATASNVTTSSVTAPKATASNVTTSSVMEPKATASKATASKATASNVTTPSVMAPKATALKAIASKVAVSQVTPSKAEAVNGKVKAIENERPTSATEDLKQSPELVRPHQVPQCEPPSSSSRGISPVNPR
ncbi:MAG: hypothetical protein Q9193_005895, partial [Seirophora villosa]